MDNFKRCNYKHIFTNRKYDIAYNKTERFMINYKKITDNKTFIQRVLNLGFFRIVILKNKRNRNKKNEYFVLKTDPYMTQEEIGTECEKNDKERRLKNE